MSAILDALKKSETDRKKGNSPDFASAQMLMTGRKKKLPAWVWLVVALLTVNLIAIVVFFIHNQDANSGNAITQYPEANREPVMDDRPSIASQSDKSGDSTNITDKTQALDEDTDVALAKRAAKIAYSRSDEISRQPTTPQNNKIDDSDYAIKAPETVLKPVQGEVEDSTYSNDSLDTPDYAESVPYLSDMDRSFQQQIPNLVFNSHIYASSASRRRIMINNEYLSQGQKIDGLVIEEITPDGVVLSKDGTQFKLSVVRNWSFQ